jgi:hypothetical protein
MIPLDGSEVAVMHVGMFSFWDVATGRKTGEPLPLRPDFDLELDRDLFPRAGGVQYPLALPRPGHPRQAVVMTPSAVEVWDLDERRSVATFQVPRSRDLGGAFVYPDTPFIGIRYGDSGVAVELWYPERDGGDERTLLPIPSDADPLGMTADGKLITEVPDGLAIWNLQAGVSVTSLALPTAAWLGPRGSGTGVGGLVGLTEAGMLTLDMDPDRWFEHLCQLNDRPYTGEERGRLPEGADPTPPCETG